MEASTSSLKTKFSHKCLNNFVSSLSFHVVQRRMLYKGFHADRIFFIAKRAQKINGISESPLNIDTTRESFDAKCSVFTSVWGALKSNIKESRLKIIENDVVVLLTRALASEVGSIKSKKKIRNGKYKH